METWYAPSWLEKRALPPETLMERVAGHRDGEFFLISGMKTFRECSVVLPLHRLGKLRRILDWGCGCGRLTRYLVDQLGGAEIHGCDIDPEAILWCDENLRPGKFQGIHLFPPTPYSDGEFDLAISISVLTHLSEVNQKKWLSEIRRILVSGGMLLTSVHGEFAAEFKFGPQKARQILAGGIFDEADPRLSGIVPSGYYRGTYQTREYIEREWTRDFDLLDYRERGTDNFQDLVLLRRK